jgi:hypothetical protein
LNETTGGADGLKKSLTDLFYPVMSGQHRQKRNETEKSTYKYQTLFMVVAGHSYGVACTNAKI